MKKHWMIMALLGAALLAGCAKQAPEASTLQTTPLPAELPAEQTETQPEPLPRMAQGLILADRVPGVLAFAGRGDQLALAGEYDEAHYVVALDQGYGVVAKNLVRGEDRQAYTPWEGHALWAARLYGNFNLTGEGEELTSGTKMQVLEDLGTAYLVEIQGKTGYVPKDKVSAWGTGGGDSGGGSNNGGSGGGDSGSSGGSEGQDGGDIDAGALSAPAARYRARPLMTLVPQEGTRSGTLTVLADETPICLGWFDRQDPVQVVTEPGFRENPRGYVTVFLKELYIWVPEALIRMPGQQAYETWEGFAGNGAGLYEDYLLTRKAQKPVWANKAVTVLEDLGDSYLVSLEEELFYMAKDQVSRTRVPVYSGGDGGSSDGGSGGGGGDSGPEWTPPKM